MRHASFIFDAELWSRICRAGALTCMFRVVRIAVGVVVLAALLGCGVIVGSTYYKRHRAEALLREVARLKLGQHPTFADAQHLAQSYGGEPWNGPSRKANCSSESCNLRFAFENKPLSYLPGVRTVEFVVGLTVKDGYVISSEIDYSILTSSYYEFIYFIEDHSKSTDVHGYQLDKLKIDSQGIPHVLKVSLSPLATSEDRARAYSLDLSCLARLSGCNSPSAIFPRDL